MSEPVPPSAAAEVQAHLRNIARILHECKHLGPETQKLMADLVEELSNALSSSTVPSKDLAHMTECAAHLAQAAKQPQAPEKVTTARDRLENAIIRIETEFPTVAGVGRRLIDALGELGI